MPTPLPSPRKEIARAIDKRLSDIKASGAEIYKGVLLGSRSKIEATLARDFELVSGPKGIAFCKKRGSAASYDWVQNKLYISYDPLKPIISTSAQTTLHELMHVEEKHSGEYPMAPLSIGTYKLTTGPEIEQSERNTNYIDGFFNTSSDIASAEQAFAKPAPTLADHVDRLFDFLRPLAELDRLDKGQLRPSQKNFYEPIHKDLNGFLGLDIGFETVRGHYAKGAAGEPMTTIARNWAKLGPLVDFIEAEWRKNCSLSSEAALRRDYTAVGLPGPAIDAIIAHLENVQMQVALLWLAERLEKRIGPDAARLFPNQTLPLFDLGGSADMPGRADKELPDLTLQFRKAGKTGGQFSLRLVGRWAGKVGEEILLCGWRIALDAPAPQPLAATASTVMWVPDMARTQSQGEVCYDLLLSAKPPQVFLDQSLAIQALASDPEALARHVKDTATGTPEQPYGAEVVAMVALPVSVAIYDLFVLETPLELKVLGTVQFANGPSAGWSAILLPSNPAP